MRIFSSKGWLAINFVVAWALYAWALCVAYRFAMILFDSNEIFSLSTWSAFFESTIVGARFDWAVIAVLWFIPFVLLCLPGGFGDPRHQIVIWLSRISLVLLSLFLLTDLVYFLAYGSHAGLELFMPFQWLQWYVAKVHISLICIFIVALIVAIILIRIRRIERALKFARSGWRHVVFILLVMGLMLRGGITSRPLHVVDAFRGDNPLSALYAINGVYLSLREFFSGQNERIPRDIFVQAHKRHQPNYECSVVKRYAKKNQAKQNAPNLVVVMLNGWRKSDADSLDLTPHYNQIEANSWSFENAYSAGQGVRVGVYTVLTGSPPLGGSQQLAWGLANDRVPRIGYLLATREYTTVLTHGYDPQYLRLDLLADSLGIDYYLTQEDLPQTTDPETGEAVAQREALWDGVFEFADQVRGPFAAFIITPWRRVETAQSNKSAINESQQQILNIDQQLGEFIQQSKERGWGQNTVFIFVGIDNLLNQQYGIIDEDWKVPFIVSGAGVRRQNDVRVIGPASVLPTIIDYAGVDRPFASVAESLLKRQVVPTLIMQPPLIVGLNDNGYVRIAGERTMDVSAFHSATNAKALSKLEQDTFNQLNCIWRRYEVFDNE